MGRGRIALVACGIWLGASCACAAGVRDLADGWRLGPGTTAVLLGSGPGDPGPRQTGFWVLAGTGRLHALPELPLTGLEFGGRLGRGAGWPTVRLGWQRTGRGVFEEDRHELSLGWGRRFAGALVGRMHLWRSGGGMTVRRSGQQQEWLLQVRGSWHWSASGRALLRVQMRLGTSQPADTEPRTPARRALATMILSEARAALVVAVERRISGEPAFSLEGMVAHGGAAWGLRLEPSVRMSGFVLAWRRGGLLVRTSHLAHPQLGLTHRVQVGVGNWASAPW